MDQPARHVRTPDRPERAPIRFRPANLLLLVPLLALAVPLYNRLEPTLLGLPFFYWFLLAILLMSIAFTALFLALTSADDDEDGGWYRP